MRGIVFTTVLGVMLAACSPQIGSSPTTRISGFDNARVVDINPHGLACTSGCLGMGAQWKESNPEVAFLTLVVYWQTLGLGDAVIRIDGSDTALKPTSTLTDFSDIGDPLKTSSRTYVVPLNLLRQIVSSKRTWVRVSTTEGNIEDAVISEGLESKALYALRRFLAEVEPAAG